MARTSLVFAGGGLLLGALGAVGWHFQPVLPGQGPPRPASQLLQSLSRKTDTTGPFYSGAVADSELSWWHSLSPTLTAVLPVTGGVVGAVVGVLVATASSHARRVRLVGAASLGLVLGGISALAWHWDPELQLGGPWNGGWFWPVDLLYPALGLLLALSAGAVLTRRRPVRSQNVAEGSTT